MLDYTTDELFSIIQESKFLFLDCGGDRILILGLHRGENYCTEEQMLVVLYPAIFIWDLISLNYFLGTIPNLILFSLFNIIVTDICNNDKFIDYIANINTLYLVMLLLNTQCWLQSNFGFPEEFLRNLPLLRLSSRGIQNVTPLKLAPLNFDENQWKVAKREWVVKTHQKVNAK